MEEGHTRETATTGLIAAFDLGEGALRVAVKDCIDIAGLPTRQGSAVFAEQPPAAAHAELVDNLLASGAWRIVGKAAMHELAFGVTGVNPWGGTPVNPQWPDRIVGGSSSGSAAAVASGTVDMAIGTDTGGSVRLPAACCGVIGFKPGLGVVSRRGVHPGKSSLDCAGVFARSMDVIEQAMQALVPGFARADAPGPIRLLRLSPKVDLAVEAAFSAALARLPVTLRDGELPALEGAFGASLVIMGAENWAALGPYADHPAMGEDVRARLKLGGEQTAQGIAEAEQLRGALIAQIDGLLEQADALVLPTLPIIPPTLAEAHDARAVVPLTRLVRPFNLSGHPAITLPIRTVQGLPAGVQLVGRRGGDAALLALASKIFEALNQQPDTGEVRV
ncbi:amidase [Novosphingobium rosa]|uniref:amidase n=1 Tax=Novosphingobium rosa TaxID=76978 RepID=UPI00083319F1|nr:amidase [Novosphingobium rosa]